MRAVQLSSRLALLAVSCWCATSASGLRLPGVQLPSRRAVVYKPLTLKQAINRPQQDDDALVLVVGVSPRRRDPQQPLLTFSPEARFEVPYAVQQLMVQGMKQLQQLGMRGGFGLQLDILPDSPQGGTGKRPLVVFDASTGRVLLGPTVLHALQRTPVHVVSAAVQATTAAAQELVHLAGQVIPQDSSTLMQLVPKAVAAGIAAVFVAAVPKWFCFVCPIVLGLLAPFLINAGVGEAANLACKAMQLPDDECVDLWFAALGLGMILSLLSAIPIYKVCRLYECAHPGPNSTASIAAA